MITTIENINGKDYTVVWHGEHDDQLEDGNDYE